MKKIFTGNSKIWKVMKICAGQGMIAMIVCGMAVAYDNNGQLLENRVTIQLIKVPLVTALNEIEKKANLKFVYSPDHLDLKAEITLDVTNATVAEVLEKIFTQNGITFSVHETEATITLKNQTGRPRDTSQEEAPVDANEPIKITGKVTDGTRGISIAGCNVIIKGTTTGTTTDAEGKFAIAADEADILVFSFIGFVTQEVRVNGQTTINITLAEDVKNLNEVVVNAGYYQTTREYQTGNIGRLEAMDIEKQPVANTLSALQARVPGLEITQSTGVPGGNFKVRIRGSNSIANGNDPLYIINGVPYTSNSFSFQETSGSILGNPNPVASQGSSPLNSINPMDIESIEVLKDADATAIYGSRGSNGVILITTKKGKAGKTKVDINLYTGFSKVASKMDLLSTEQYLEMRREGYANDNISPTIDDAPDLISWDTTKYTDWQKELIGGTAHTMDGQVSLSGGDQQTQFSIGTGFHKETTVFPGENSDRRISTRLSLSNSSLEDRLKTSVSINYSMNQSNLLKEDLTFQALTLPPIAPALKDENGTLSWKGWNYDFENPLAFLQRKYESTTNNLVANTTISYSIHPTFELKANLGYTNTSMKAITTTPVSSMDPAIIPYVQNSSWFSNSNFQNWIAEPQLNWKPVFNNNRIDVLIGTTFLGQLTDGLAQGASGFSSEALMKNISAATTRTTATNFYQQYRYHAVFSRINYTMRDKYVINLTGRRDGSSRFGPGEQFANFGAVGAAWIFSKEDFIKASVPILSFGKLRGSAGTNGNDQLGDYQYLDTYRPSGIYQGTVGLAPVRLGNPDFAWETNRKLEAGIDLGFIDDRIMFTAAYFNNKSSNQLVGFPLPSVTGFRSIQGNLPAVIRNSGVEITFNTENVKSTAFSWSTAFNISIPKNRLIEFPDLKSSPAYANTYVIGQPLSIRKLYISDGRDPVTGYYRFTDVNNDGALNIDDRQAVGFVGPKYFGGFQNSFRVYGFQLDIMFQFVKQTGNNYLLQYGLPPGQMLNQPAFVMDRAGSQTTDGLVQPFTASFGQAFRAYNFLKTSDQAVTDASFVRLKNLSLSYTIPTNGLNKLHLENARLFVQGQNLMTLTKFKGLDPETQSTYLPPLKVLSFGFHATF